MWLNHECPDCGKIHEKNCTPEPNLRCDMCELKKMSDTEIVNSFKNLYWITSIYGQVGMSDLRRMDQLEYEMDRRLKETGIDIFPQQEFEKWAETKRKEWQHEEQAMLEKEYPIIDEQWKSRRWNLERTDYIDLSGDEI